MNQVDLSLLIGSVETNLSNDLKLNPLRVWKNKYPALPFLLFFVFGTPLVQRDLITENGDCLLGIKLQAKFVSTTSISSLAMLQEADPYK